MNKKGLLHDCSFLKHFLLGFAILMGATVSSEAKSRVLGMTDTIPLRDRTGDYLRDSVIHPFNLSDPAVINKSVEFDPLTNRYIVTEKIGDDFYFRAPTVMTYDEYLTWKSKGTRARLLRAACGFEQKERR